MAHVVERPQKKYPLTKKIGIAVLALTEIMITGAGVYCIIANSLSDLVAICGMQLFVFGAFWGSKAVADNVKVFKGVE